MGEELKEEILDGIRRHIHPLGGFEKAQLLIAEEGHIKLRIQVEENGLNLYGHLHGGYIFTLCDSISGMCAYSHGVTNVTQQGSINFIRGFQTGLLFVEAHTLHRGRKTAVIRVEVTSEEGKLIASGNFSMFLGKPV